jgi:hypothetical protein
MEKYDVLDKKFFDKPLDFVRDLREKLLQTAK